MLDASHVRDVARVASAKSAAAMHRRLALGAAAVLVVGLLIRLAPVVTSRIWGSDTGEYFFLTERLLSEGLVSFEYDGWGIAYPYFPAMYLVTGAVVAVAGVDLLPALQWVVPAVSGLIGLGVLLVTHRATGSAVAALTAGAFAAVTAPNVIVTSHAMPGTLGHVLVLVALFASLAAREDRRFVFFLAPALLALLVAHHLSLYFFVGVVAGGAFLRELGSDRWDRGALRVEAPTVLASVALASWWWLGVSPRMREDIVGDAFDVHPLLTAAAFSAALLVLPLLVLARRRLAPGWRWRPRVLVPERGLRLAVAFAAAFLALVGLFIVTGVPGTNIRVTWTTVVYVLPVVPILVLALVGSGAAKFTRAGFFLWGWMAAVLTSLVFTAATGNRVIFPYRHVDYLMEAVAAVAGVGFVVALGYVRGAGPAPRRVLIAGLAIVLVVGAAMSYPPREAVGGFEEAVSDAELEGVLWARDHLPAGATVAADHRVSSLLFGLAKMRATWDYTYWTYHAESWDKVEEELRALDIPSGAGERIDYVFLSQEIREGVTLVQWENSKPMSEAAWNKFFEDAEHYAQVYGADGAYVFRVRWENA